LPVAPLRAHDNIVSGDRSDVRRACKLHHDVEVVAEIFEDALHA
jgi:hypothetical protein